MADILKIGEGIRYSRNTKETRCNNNVIVFGTSGSGKTTGFVIPNLLEMTGSYVICDPKGNLYRKYGTCLEKHGYEVKQLSFSGESKNHYNFFSYLENEQDILRLAHLLVYGSHRRGNADPFWDQSSEILLSGLISYLHHCRPRMDRNLSMLCRMLTMCVPPTEGAQSKLDRLFERKHSELSGKIKPRREPDAFSIRQYRKFSTAAYVTKRSIVISAQAQLGRFDSRELQKKLGRDDMNLTDIGRKKTAVFLEVSDHDRSMDTLCNLFISQVIQVLCREADRSERGELEVPVQFILDDFATNIVVPDFPKIISSARSRGISFLLMLQAESQLKQMYDMDYRTIIGNCDTYVYLGGNDLDTAENVAKRADILTEDVLYMPVGAMWVFRRGEKARYCRLERRF